MLLFDPDGKAQRATERLMKQGWPIARVATAAEAKELLSQSPVALVVSWVGASDRRGAAVLRAAARLAPGAGRIVSSDGEDGEALVRLANQGGIAFVLGPSRSTRQLHNALTRIFARRGHAPRTTARPAKRPRLRPAKRPPARPDAGEAERAAELRQAVEQLRKALAEIEQKNKALTLLNENLKIQSTTDHLTGLLNRREFLNRLRVEWGRFTRYHRPLSLVMIDIDHFKVINDTYGHDCGDTVLESLSSLIRRHQRSHDSTGRYGGEEFLVLMPETPLDSGFLVAEGLRKLVGNFDFRCKTHHIPVHISLGVAGVLEQEPADIESFIKLADVAMYRAKRAGRNRTVVVDAKDPERILRQTQ